MILNISGTFEDAVFYYNESLKLKQDYYGNEHESVAHAFIALAKALMSNKEYIKAYSRFESGNRILELNHGRFTIHSANCYVCMAQIKHKMKEYLDSYNLYEAALDIYANLLGKNHLYTYRIHLNLLYLAFVLEDAYKINFLEKRLLELLDGAVIPLREFFNVLA